MAEKNLGLLDLCSGSRQEVTYSAGDYGTDYCVADSTTTV